MPKKGGGKLSERERARLAVVPDLYAIYSGLLSESVIDMIAKQCDYDMDACVATLGDMVQDHPAVRPTHQPPTHATGSAPATAAAAPAANPKSQQSSWTTPHTSFGASSASSNVQLKPPSIHSASASSSSSAHSAPSAAAASSSTDSGAAVPAKKKGGILFLSPRPSSELNKPQPPSVWKNAGNAKQPAKRPWSGLAPPAGGAGAGATGGGGSAHAGLGVDNSSSYSGAKALVAASASASGAASSSSSYEQDLAAAIAASVADGKNNPSASSFEDGYGSDANDPADVAVLRRSIAPAPGASERTNVAAAVAAYTYTGFESEPYYALQPRLLAAIPAQVSLPGQSAAGHVFLDPEAPSAAQVAPAPADAANGDGVSESSPAHPRHPLHALYLQLNQAQEPAPAPARASWQQFAGANAAAAPPPMPSDLGAQEPSEAELSAMTPAQAAAFQRRQHEAELASRRQFTGWMKQHERDKAQVKLRGIRGEEDERQREREEREERELAQALAAVAEAEAAAAAADGLSHLSLSPTDIPPMPPLSHSQSRSSQEAVQAHPQQLVAFLSDMFAHDIDPAVVAAVVESVLAAAPPPPPLRGSGVEQRAAGTAQSAEERFEYRDLAQECCTTLLAILEEEDRKRDAEMHLDHLLAEQQQQQEQQQMQQQQQQQQQMQQQSQPSVQHGGPRGGKAWKKQQAELSAGASDLAVPFVAAGLQMSDAEIAARMAVDPDFDPNALQWQQVDTGRALAAASRASVPAAPVHRNKKGHVLVNRGAAPNAWVAHTPAAASVAPDLGAQWKLAALVAAFPFVDRETIDQCFQANAHNFEDAKAHLAQLFPRALVDPAARPQPVATPWARRQQHHSKVQSTSAADAQRGIITEQRVQERAMAAGGAGGGAGASGGAASGSGLDESGFSDELLETALGPVLDNRSGGGGGVGYPSQSSAASDSSLRALADAHARRRAAYFGAAAAAFNRGSGAVAAQLAAQGRAERAELRRAQSAAALSTFVAQNQQQDCARCVDLHGLRVDEALHILAFVLQRHRRRAAAGGMRAGGGGGSGGAQSPSRELSVVTGVGYHSQGGVSRARLHPAVLHFLRANGYTCSAQTPGVIRVQVG